MSRTILHCDMNNFYASVECMLDMSLRGHPIAIGGDVENRHGIILAKNYEAKKYEIQTGEALSQAKQKCKDLIIVPLHYEQYLKYSLIYLESDEPPKRSCPLMEYKPLVSLQTHPRNC